LKMENSSFLLKGHEEQHILSMLFPWMLTTSLDQVILTSES
jgi:hypothetical protein